MANGVLAETVVLPPLPVTVELREALDRSARENFRSRAAEIRWALASYVREDEGAGGSRASLEPVA